MFLPPVTGRDPCPLYDLKHAGRPFIYNVNNAMAT